MFAREFTQGQNNLLQPVAAPSVSLALCHGKVADLWRDTVERLRNDSSNRGAVYRGTVVAGHCTRADTV